MNTGAESCVLRTGQDGDMGGHTDGRARLGPGILVVVSLALSVRDLAGAIRDHAGAVRALANDRRRPPRRDPSLSDLKLTAKGQAAIERTLRKARIG